MPRIKVALPDDSIRYFNGSVTRFAQGGRNSRRRRRLTPNPFVHGRESTIWEFTTR